MVFVAIGWFANVAWHMPKDSGNPISVVKPRPLEKYSFEHLSKVYHQDAGPLDGSQITIGNIISENQDFTSYEFMLEFSPDLSKNTKKVTGLINVPKGDGPFPAVVMFRGYVDQTIYKIGVGTQHAGEFFAKNGYITIAPDFLGYGNSDKESGDIFETRFQTYTTALAVLTAVKNAQTSLKVDLDKIYLWGHSNGGQIALALLEITGEPYKTVLWAPNSAKFPYSIIYYLDEASDQGKLIITKLSEFMGDYDVTKYSIRSFIDQINTDTKIQVHQGTADEAVPYVWNDTLVKQIKAGDIKVEYFKYAGANHNLVPSWNQVVTTSLEFFNTP